MNNIFLIFGYCGVPKDILKDENYNLYLRAIFNNIYDICQKQNILKPIIITCGGKTDTIKPYKRTEAEEMFRWFDSIIENKAFLKHITKNWLFFKENKSLSTLENLLYSKDIIDKRKIKKANIFIFCEHTRQIRVKILAKKVFVKNYKINIIPIDFDVSPSRYLSLEQLAKRELLGVKHSLWALKSKENLRKYHELFEEKFRLLRSGKSHEVNQQKWWDEKLKEIEK